MGSGASGGYSLNAQNSQPFAPTYHVTQDMKQYDIDTGVYKGTYLKNPTAKKLTDVINGNYVVNKNLNGSYTYVIDMNGDIIFGNRNGKGTGNPSLRTPHPTLIGGKNPQVKMAGIITFRGGKIEKYDNRSGHFKPNIKSIMYADEAFGKLPKKLFYNKRSKK